MRTGWMLAFLLSLLSLVAAGAAPSGDMPIAQNTGADKFQKVPGLPDCLTVAVEQGDPGKDASLLLVKTTAGCKVPWHFHTPNEQLMMVSGIGRVEMKDEQAAELRAGGFAYVQPSTCTSSPAWDDRARFSCVQTPHSIPTMLIRMAARFRLTRR